MSIESELQALKNADGLVIVEEVHEWARKHSGSALHKALEWDNDVAAYEHRCWQIRRLIAIHVRTEEGDRALLSLSIDRVRDGGGYRGFDDIKQSRDLYQILLTDALNELERVRTKYERLQELEPIWQAAREVRRRRGKGGGEEKRAAAS